MNNMEIILLVIGVLAFVVSFLIPNGRSGGSERDREMAIDEINDLVDKEFDRIKDQVDDTVEEAVKDSVEGIERSLERISNEKIMAVNEYSDTVLEQINKNHQEITFLYDMLNAKHDSLKKTASEVEQKIRTAETVSREVEAATRAAEMILRDTETPPQTVDQAEDTAFQVLQSEEENGGQEQVLEEEVSALPREGLQESNSYQNKNELIRELHRQGWSDVTIAKRLDLGVGEVKLVIDLFEGRNNS